MKDKNELIKIKNIKTVSEIAAIFKKNDRGVRTNIARGSLKAFKCGEIWLVDIEDAKKFYNRVTTEKN